MSPNRIVAVLTPLVFAPLAGAVSTLVAKHFPGVDIPASRLEEIFIAGALIAFAKGAQWLHGWQKYEQREAERRDEADLARREEAVAAREAELAGMAGDEDVLLAPDPDLDLDDAYAER